MPESVDYEVEEGTPPEPESGDFGGGITIKYLFDTTTTDSDPGSGKLRLDNATQNVATTIRIDPLDAQGADWSTVIFQNVANAATGLASVVRVVKKDDFTRWIAFYADQVSPQTGYFNVNVLVLTASHANPFTNGDEVVFMSAANGVPGIAGSDGGPGSDGVAGANGSPSSIPDIQVFGSPGTYTNGWVKPTPPVGGSLGNVERCLIAGGGGGGSGRQGLGATIRGGGGGGGGGGYSRDSQAASLFNSTETVIVGAGGSGGAGASGGSANGTAGLAGGLTSMTGSNGAGTLTASGGGGGGGGTTAAGAAGAAGAGTTQNGAAGGAGSILTGLAPDGGEITTSPKMAGGGGGGGAGITAANTNTTTGGYGGASGGGRTGRTLGLLASATANCIPHYAAAVGFSGVGVMSSAGPVNYGGGGGAGGGNCLNYATAFCGNAAGGSGGKYGGGGGGGAGYTNGVNVSNDGFFGGDGIAIIITHFS